MMKEINAQSYSVYTQIHHLHIKMSFFKKTADLKSLYVFYRFIWFYLPLILYIIIAHIYLYRSNMSDFLKGQFLNINLKIIYFYI